MSNTVAFGCDLLTVRWHLSDRVWPRHSVLTLKDETLGCYLRTDAIEDALNVTGKCIRSMLDYHSTTKSRSGEKCSKWDYCSVFAERITNLERCSNSVSERSTGTSVSALLSMKMAVGCSGGPCGLVDVYRLFRGAFCLYHQGHEWGGGPLKAGKLVTDYTMQQPTRRPS
jgi:hypothetical protein